jgi:hypothetical protein
MSIGDLILCTWYPKMLRSFSSKGISTSHIAAIPAGLHFRLSCMTPFGLMQICSRQICAGIQNTGM